MKRRVKIIKNRSLNEEKIEVIKKLFFRILDKKIKKRKIEIKKKKKKIFITAFIFYYNQQVILSIIEIYKASYFRALFIFFNYKSCEE